MYQRIDIDICKTPRKHLHIMASLWQINHNIISQLSNIMFSKCNHFHGCFSSVYNTVNKHICMAATPFWSKICAQWIRWNRFNWTDAELINNIYWGEIFSNMIIIKRLVKYVCYLQVYMLFVQLTRPSCMWQSSHCILYYCMRR